MCPDNASAVSLMGRAWAGALAEDRPHLLALAAIVAIAGGLRIAYLFEPAHLDEAYSFLTYASQPLRVGLTGYSLPNNHLFHTLLVHGVWRLLGDELWAIRLPALLAGIALVPAAYAAARLLYDRHAGLWAAALMATSSPLVEYSTNARGYSVATLLLLLSIVAGSRLLESPRGARWILMTLAWALAIYTVPFMAVGVGVVALWLLANRHDRRFAARLALACAGVGVACLILYLPTVGDAGWSFREPVPEGRFDVARNVLAQWGERLPAAGRYVLMLAAVAAVVLHRRTASHPFPLGLACVPVVALVGLAAPVPPFTRVWLFLLPVYLITAASGLGYLARVCGLGGQGAVRAAALPLLLALGLATTIAIKGPTYAYDAPQGDNEIARFVGSRLQPGERALVGSLTYFPIAYYFRRDGVPGLATRLARADVVDDRVLVIAHSDLEATEIVRDAGLAPARAADPIQTYRWISVYAVAVA